MLPLRVERCASHCVHEPVLLGAIAEEALEHAAHAKVYSLFGRYDLDIRLQYCDNSDI